MKAEGSTLLGRLPKSLSENISDAETHFLDCVAHGRGPDYLLYISVINKLIAVVHGEIRRIGLAELHNTYYRGY